MSAQVIDFASARRRVLATRIERARHDDACPGCGGPVLKDELIRPDDPAMNVWHFECFVESHLERAR